MKTLNLDINNLTTDEDVYSFEARVQDTEFFKILVRGSAYITFDVKDESFSHSFGTERVEVNYIDTVVFSGLTIFDDEGEEISLSSDLTQELKNELENELNTLTID